MHSSKCNTWNDRNAHNFNTYGHLAIFTQPVEAAKRPLDKMISNSQAFISQHPDLLYRLRGLDAYKKARFSEAVTNFKRAAKYADKPSQGMMEEML